ncbi:MAG: hypothetical protein AAB515_00405 [Patescibacteria group bacterium]
MKTAYQPNLLKAMLGVACIVTAATFWLFLRNNQTSERMVSIRIKNAHVRPSAFTAPETKPTQKNIGGGTRNKELRGQFGENVRVIPETPAPTIARQLKTPVHTLVDIAVTPDTNISVSDLEEADIGKYVPEAEYVYEAPPPETTVVEPTVVQCSVVEYVEPEYPMFAKENGKEGVAKLIVFVDTLGNLTLFPEEIMSKLKDTLEVKTMTAKIDGEKHRFNYVVDYEDPPDFFFAANVAKVLKEWRFRPAARNGSPINSLLVVSHAFCLTGDCNTSFTQTGQYMRP